jgi:hypothetical protein
LQEAALLLYVCFYLVFFFPVARNFGDPRVSGVRVRGSRCCWALFRCFFWFVFSMCVCVFVLVLCICVSLFHTSEGVGCCFFSRIFFRLCLELFLHLLLEDLKSD